jgi:hypothetical protein
MNYVSPVRKMQIIACHAKIKIKQTTDLEKFWITNAFAYQAITNKEQI